MKKNEKQNLIEDEKLKDALSDTEKENNKDITKLISSISWGIVVFYCSSNADKIKSAGNWARTLSAISFLSLSISIFSEFFACIFLKNFAKCAQNFLSTGNQICHNSAFQKLWEAKLLIKIRNIFFIIGLLSFVILVLMFVL